MEKELTREQLAPQTREHGRSHDPSNDAETGLEVVDIQRIEKVYRKIDLRIIPAFWTLYFLCSAIRSNVGLAQTMNLAQEHDLGSELNITPKEISTGLALFYVCYVIFDLPSNLVMTRLSPRVWMSRIVIAVGIIGSCMAAMKAAWSFYLLRLLLGTVIAGMWPGMAYYLTLFYPPSRTGKRIGQYFTAAQVSAAVVSLVSAGFQKMDGLQGLVGFQWMFLLYGLVAICVGIGLLWWLPDRPLPPGETPERTGLHKWIPRSRPALTGEDALIHYQDLTRVYRRPRWTMKDLWHVVTDWRLWPLFVMYFGVVGVGIGVQNYATVIIRGTNANLTSIQLSLLAAPIWIMDLIAILLVTPFSDRFHRHRGLFFSVPVCIQIAGLLMTTYAGSVANPWPRYGGLLLVGFGLGPTVPITMTWTNEIFQPRHGEVGVAAAAALVSGLGNLGSILTTYALFAGWPSDARAGRQQYRKSTLVMVGILCLSIVSAAVMTLLLRHVGNGPHAKLISSGSSTSEGEGVVVDGAARPYPTLISRWDPTMGRMIGRLRVSRSAEKLVMMDVLVESDPARVRMPGRDKTRPPWIADEFHPPFRRNTLSMVAGLGRCTALFCLADCVSNVVALPNPPRPSHDADDDDNDIPQHTGEPAAEGALLQARVMNGASSAVIAADIPTAPQQSQNIATTDRQGQLGVIPNLNITPEEVDCSDLSTGRDNKCWQELQLTAWVSDWIAANTCYQNEAFSSCFLRKAGYPELDCTGIKLDTCTPPSVKAGMDPRVFYVAYNFYSINQYFGSWYSAIGGAATLAALNVDEIVQLINPPDNTNLIINSILIALTGLFAVIPGLGANVGNLLDKVVKNSAETAHKLRTSLVFVENAIHVSPRIGLWLYPMGDTQSQLVQMADLKGRLGELIQQVQGNLNHTVAAVMANPTDYLAFAAQGNFTASAPSLPDQQQYLLYGFNTYLISVALAGNNIRGAVALDTNVQALVTNGSYSSQKGKDLAFDLSACEGYSAQNVCDAFWYSGALDATFSLNSLSDMDRGFGDLLATLFAKFTTGQLLFDNAYACNANRDRDRDREKDDDDDVAVTVNAAGLNTQCLSQLKIHAWDMACDGVRDKTCEFRDGQESQGMWLTSCGSQSYFSVMDEPVYCVPNGYLGPLVRQRKYKLDRGG
ncbi:MAG: hypothetical protein Q9173_006080 [Seirophora scorigena]